MSRGDDNQNPMFTTRACIAPVQTQQHAQGGVLCIHVLQARMRSHAHLYSVRVWHRHRRVCEGDSLHLCGMRPCTYLYSICADTKPDSMA
jgi:hypothetical protein